MKAFLKMVTALILLQLNSCDILDNDSSSVVPLDSKINFKVIESFDGYETISTPEIFIEMQTEKIYGCYNYGISTILRFEDRIAIIDIKGIYKPGYCATALGPANGRVKPGFSRGVYEIEFSNENFRDKYNLMITDSLIIIDGYESPDTKPLAYFVWRFPKNSFAYIWNRGTQDSLICFAFIDSLKSVISLKEYTFSDLAEIPYPKTSEYRNITYYTYYNENDFNKISTVMKSFKQSHFPNNEVYISIENWMNKKILSWVL